MRNKLLQLKEQLQKQPADVVMIASLIGIGLLTLVPLSRTGFTTNDDITQQIYALKLHFNVWPIVQSFAYSQGRFYFLFSGFLIFIPFLINHWWYIKGIALISVGINALLVGLLSSRIFKNRWFGYLAVLLFFTIIQNTWEHNLLNAYPLVFTFGMSCLLSSLICFLNYCDGKPIKFLLFSTGLYALSLLTYEVFLVYAPLFIVISFFKFRTTQKTGIIGKLSAAVPAVLVSLIYGIIYTIFRYYHPSTYDGNQLLGGTNLGFLKTTFQFGISSMPGYIFMNNHYRELINTYSYSVEGDQRDPLFILTHLQLSWFLKAGIAAAATVLFAMKAAFSDRRYRLVLILLPLTVAYVFLPGTLLATTAKYQSWVQVSNAISFTVTYFSFFSAVLAGVNLIAAGLITSKTKRQKTIFGCLLAVAIGGLCVITDFSNYHVTLSQQQASLRWDAVNEFVSSNDFKTIPENSFIYAPSLWSGIQHQSYWEDYVLTITGKKTLIFQNPYPLLVDAAAKKPSGNPAYFISYNQEPKDVQQFLLFSSITSISTASGQLTVTSNKATLYTRGKYKQYYVFIPLSDDKKKHTVTVDGRLYETDKDYVLAYINKQWPGNAWVVTSITGDAFKPNEIILSHYTDSPVHAQ